MPTRLEVVVARVIDELFDRAKARFLGRKWGPKKIVIEWRPDLTLPGIFAEASREEGARPNERLFGQLARQATAFLDAQKLSARAKALAAVRSFVADAAIRGIEADPVVALGAPLSEIWKQAAVGVAKIFEGEGQVAKNVSIQDAVMRASASVGIADPIVCFMAPRDDDTCRECLRLHFINDGSGWCPRVWKMSELKSGYAKRGDSSPSLGGQHPHCRGTLVTIFPGYGFVDGSLEYVSADHDEYARQAKMGSL